MWWLFFERYLYLGRTELPRAGARKQCFAEPNSTLLWCRRVVDMCVRVFVFSCAQRVCRTNVFFCCLWRGSRSWVSNFRRVFSCLPVLSQGTCTVVNKAGESKDLPPGEYVDASVDLTSAEGA